MIHLNDFANVVPDLLSGESPHHVQNLVRGEWRKLDEQLPIPDPLTGEDFIYVPSPYDDDIDPFVEGLRSCSKSGLHNPFKNVERYRMLGAVSARAAAALADTAIEYFFARLIQRVMPKSLVQCMGEVTVTQKFLENFSGDQPRFLATGFSVPGDHLGQESRGYRWPYGSVVIIAPFNFPLEIPVLQLMGALYMGNRPLLHVDWNVSIVMEQFLRLLHACGLPKIDVDFFNGGGGDTGNLIEQAADHIRMVQFTGGTATAEKVNGIMGGRVKVEDAGFDWKILGPIVPARGADDIMHRYVAWQCDQDAYAASGQKCSAQSIVFVHQDWIEAGFTVTLEQLARRRRLEDLTVGPVLTWTTEGMLLHVNRLCEMGGTLLFGGKPLEGHSIPECYGAIEPTAVSMPLGVLEDTELFPTVTTEVFGPLQVIVPFATEEISRVLELLERMSQHLTAAVVSEDSTFINKVVGATVNGTTYVGLRARTTGAPQNHFFGPAGDPRAAGIGTPQAIINTWSCHREVVYDVGPLPKDWELPAPT